MVWGDACFWFYAYYLGSCEVVSQGWDRFPHLDNWYFRTLNVGVDDDDNQQL